MRERSLVSGLIFNLLKPGIQFFSNTSLSIRTKIMFSFFIIIVLMGATNATMIVSGLQYRYQYDNLLRNITTANSINGYVKPTIDGIVWDIVSGRRDFKEGAQYQVIDDIDAKISEMKRTANSDKGRLKLDVILRTMTTLRSYVDLLGQQIDQGKGFDENQQVLDKIHSITELVNANIQDYLLFEINRTEQNYRETQENFTRWSIISLLIMSAVIFLAIILAWIISESIYDPIKKLQNITTTLADQDLEALVNRENRDEIAQLGRSFNAMVLKIRELLDYKLKEQENLKKYELKLLQAQINPHFLYNTLDTIIWLAEANQNARVIEIVRALSSFFRVTLSKGKDWIKISEEIEHVRSYLTIQKMRYHDILDFRIEVDEATMNGTILKLTLQPLVENALYHGIKNKRQGGMISIRCLMQPNNMIFLEVKDDGVGFTPTRLEQLKADLEDDNSPVEISESGFGINNV
ncbi:MAG: sensor histidine kinase, partial [Anaerolineae bacterium]|nr:sensor histidine kinase [Anaerolineae bacterium]